MLYSQTSAGECEPSALVGFPPRHSELMLKLAREREEVILFRDVGPQCRGLIEAGHGMKGFRIDTKSCDWGPMAGFVCMDPRLNKAGSSKEAFNRKETHHAITGRVTNLGGSVPLHQRNAVIRGETQLTDWAATARPVVISRARLEWLTQRRLVTLSAREVDDQGFQSIGGISRSHDGTITLPWRLIEITNTRLTEQGLEDFFGTLPTSGTYYGVFVDPASAFVQEYPAELRPMQRRYADSQGTGCDPILGLANPGTEASGFKACVTGDYDLFAVWPRAGAYSVTPGHRSLGRNFNGQMGRSFGKDERQLGMNPLAWPDLARLQHDKRGNVTPRIVEVCTALNGRLQPVFQNPGDLLHHSDEVGNPGGLAKPLTECLPIIGFLPPSPRSGVDSQRVLQGGTFGLSSLADLSAFARHAQDAGFRLDLKPGWWAQLGLQRPPEPSDDFMRNAMAERRLALGEDDD